MYPSSCWLDCVTREVRPSLSVCALHNDSADVGVQVQELRERRALAAGATALDRVVNSQ